MPESRVMRRIMRAATGPVSPFSDIGAGPDPMSEYGERFLSRASLLTMVRPRDTAVRGTNQKGELRMKLTGTIGMLVLAAWLIRSGPRPRVSSTFSGLGSVT